MKKAAEGGGMRACACEPGRRRQKKGEMKRCKGDSPSLGFLAQNPDFKKLMSAHTARGKCKKYN